MIHQLTGPGTMESEPPTCWPTKIRDHIIFWYRHSRRRLQVGVPKDVNKEGGSFEINIGVFYSFTLEDLYEMISCDQ
jgi:hypothetical protein